ncbi:hypothetical protein UY3_13551, partial [Chelonia mydas]
DSRSHHSHRHHHQQVHTQSRVRPAKTQELLVPPQQSHFSSEESVENTEQQFIVHDVTEEDDSTPDAESQQVDSSKAPCAACHFPGKFDMSMEWDDRSNIQDISEVNRRSHDKSMENGSQQQLDSVEADSDNSKPDVTEDSHMSNESTEQQQAQTEDLQQVDVVPEVNDSNQTAESTEDTQDHSSIEDNEVIL